MVSYDCFGMPPETRIWVIQKWGLNLLPSTSREFLMKRLKDLGFPKGSVTPVQVSEGFSGKTGMSYPFVKRRYFAVPDSLLNSVISPYRENNLVAFPAIFSPLKERGYLPLAFESDIPVKVYKAGLPLGDCGLFRGDDGNLYIGDVNTFCSFYLPASSVVYEESKDVCYWFQDEERPMPLGITKELESLNTDEVLHAGLVRIAYQGYWLPPRVCNSEKFSAYLDAKGYSDRNVMKWTSEESVLSVLSMTKEELKESLKTIASESEDNGLSFDDIYQTDKNGDGWVLLDLVSEMVEYRKHTKTYVRKVMRESVVAQGLRKDLNEAQGSVKKVSQLESQVATLTQQLKSASGDKGSEYSQQINGLSQSLLEKQEQVTSLQESLGATEAALKEVQSKLDDATKGLTEKTTALDKANENLRSLKDALASAKKTAKSSVSILGNVKKELKATKTKYAESQATLQKQQESFKAKYAEAQDTLLKQQESFKAKYAEAQDALRKQQEPNGVQDMGDFSILMVRSGEEVTLVSDSVLESLKVLAE